MRSWARFNFYAYERPFMLCLYFICELKFYARTHVKLRDTGSQLLEWISTVAQFLRAYARKIETEAIYDGRA